MPQAVSRPSAVPRIRTLNEVIPPIVPMGTIAIHLFRRNLFCITECPKGRGSEIKDSKNSDIKAYPVVERERSLRASDGHLLADFQLESSSNHLLAQPARERLNGNVARRRFATTGFVWDNEVKGFGLRHTAAGAKRWIVQYRYRGKTRREVLGDAREMSPALARVAAKRLLAAAALDGLPQPVLPSAAKPVVTFAEFVEEFWTDYAPHWKSSTQRSNRYTIEGRLKSIFGAKPVAQITRADVVSWRDSLVERSGVFNRSIPVLSIMLGYAEKLGYRPEGSNPCKGIARYKRPLKERYLTRREFQRLAAVLAQREGSIPEFTAFVRLLIYTGARRGEIAGLHWEWIGADYIDLPDSKTGPKRLYLNAQASAVLDRFGRAASGDGLAHGRYFFMDVRRDGIALYEYGDTELHEPKPKTPAAALAMAEEYAEEWLPGADRKFDLAKIALEKGYLKDAAFLLHQATESLYHCALLVNTFYTPHVHNLIFLRTQAERLDRRLIDVWPRDRRADKSLFEKLKDAYVKARYSKHYRISVEQLSWLANRVEELGQVVHMICSERIDALRHSAAA
ncbi:HEPN domain-containing protein [Sphingomonas zeicaulis]